MEKAENINPKWFSIAQGEIGISEIAGNQDNPRILEYHQSTKLRGDNDEIPWCSAFVNWCMEKAAVSGTKSPAARSWLNWGQEIKSPKQGCVVVLKRGNSSWQGHVGFYVRDGWDSVLVLGGNQSNKVCVQQFPKSKILSYRWPVEKK